MNKELIIERYKNPKNLGSLQDCIRGFSSNTSCGDDVEVFIKYENGVVKDCKFNGAACSICMASADLLMDNLKNKSSENISKIDENLMLSQIDMKVDSPRKRCATLPLEAVKSALIGVE